jgi:hypothetical protein
MKNAKEEQQLDTHKKRQKERKKKERKLYYSDFLDRVSNYKVFMDDPDSWN